MKKSIHIYLDSPDCTKIRDGTFPRNNEAFPGEDPEWVSEKEKKELQMDSPYNMVVNIVNVESPYEDKVQADGLDKINQLVKSMLIRNNFKFLAFHELRFRDHESFQFLKFKKSL